MKKAAEEGLSFLNVSYKDCKFFSVLEKEIRNY